MHLYLCAVFAPEKPHTSLSILGNVSCPLLPSPRKALLPVTTLQSVRILSLFSYFLINQVSRAFSPPPFFSSLPPPSSALSWFKLFFCVAAPLGWAEWLDRELGQGSWFEEGGEYRGGDRCEGVALTSRGTTHCFTQRAQMTCNRKRNLCLKKGNKC